jgi:putative CocE/NonD family hydrolase
MQIDRDVMIPMRDGAMMATDIYRPEGASAAPLLLERTPYGKHLPSRSEITAANPSNALSRADVAARFVARGFAVGYQDTRGRYNSDGVFAKYLADAADGFDAVQALAEMPGLDGRVGMFGLSYSAHTQVAAASMGPPALQALVADSGGFSSAHRSGVRQGGAFELKQATWALKQARLSPEAAADPMLRAALETEDVRAWFTRMPWRPGVSPVREHPAYERYLLDQWRAGLLDDAWKQPGLYAAGYYDQFARMAQIHMSSWYDPYPLTATDNYLGLKAAGAQDLGLVLGPWTHGDRSLTYAGDVDFGDAATLDGQLAPDFIDFRADFFDRVFHGRATAGSEKPVKVFIMGGGSGRRNGAGRLTHGGVWREFADWPPPEANVRPFYLAGDGQLASSPAPSASRIDYRFDPSQPVPTIGGAISSGEPVMRGGAFDQREGAEIFGCTPPYLPLSSRPDVLTFETALLDDDVTVCGPIILQLWVSSDAVDTDFTMKLVDVHPPSADYAQGYAMIITDGILRMRYRDSMEAPELMAPGGLYAVEIEAFPTANTFLKGHRIRLDVSSSNFPKFDVNPNTGEAEGQSRQARVAINTVLHGGDTPSALLLPVLPQS